MTAVLDFLADHGGDLALGASAILGVGWVCVVAVRQPIHKQRLAELSVAAAILGLGLALVPWPRTNPIPSTSSLGRLKPASRMESSAFLSPLELDSAPLRDERELAPSAVPSMSHLASQTPTRFAE